MKRKSRLRTFWLFTLPLLGLLFSLSDQAIAGCSSHIGKVVFNEINRHNSSCKYEYAERAFIELRSLNQSAIVDSGAYKDFTLSICSVYPKNEDNSSKPRCYSGNLSVAGSDSEITYDSALNFGNAENSGNAWIVLHAQEGHIPDCYIDVEPDGSKDHGMELVLYDKDGDIVDYFLTDDMNDFSGVSTDGYLGDGGCSLVYDTDFDGSGNSFNVQRVPDGTGCWPDGSWSAGECLGTPSSPPSGNSGDETTNNTNDDFGTSQPSDGYVPYIVIDDTTVVAGNVASFTVRIAGYYNTSTEDLDTSRTTNEYSTAIQVNYFTANGTASADTSPADYTAIPLADTTYVSIAPGATSTTISVNTNNTATVDEYFSGVLYRIRNVSTVPSVIGTNNGYATFTAPPVDHLRISAATTASTCSKLEVTIRAEDSSNNLVTTYDGTISLSTSSGHGDWSTSPTSGTNPDAPVNSLSTGTSDSGTATYTFDGGASGDGGSITVYLFNQHADQNVTLSATDSTNSLSVSSSQIDFSDNAFVITPQTSTAGTANSSTLIAGRNHKFNIAMWTRNGSDCQIATNYNSSTQSIKAYIDRGGELTGANAPVLNDSLSASLNLSGTAATGTFDFSDTSGSGGTGAGIASFSIDTSDVGKYDLYIYDDSENYASGKTISGNTSLITIPFGFAIDYNNQRQADLADNNLLDDSTGSDTSYAADHNGSVFLTAGSDFNLDIEAILWSGSDDSDNDGVPDSGANLYDNTVVPNFGSETSTYNPTFSHTLNQPSGGNSGLLVSESLVVGGGSSSFSSGSTTATVNWDEVGIIDISLTLSGYLGASVNVTGEMKNIGRFTPKSLGIATANIGSLENTHTSGTTNFTYIGESFSYATDPDLLIVGLNGTVSTWQPSTAYSAGDYVISPNGNGRLYQITTAGSSDADGPSDWSSTAFDETLSDTNLTYRDVGQINLPLVRWSATTSYSVGDYVMASDGTGVYKVVTAGSSGSAEPSWSTSGTITDGTVSWQFLADRPYTTQNYTSNFGNLTLGNLNSKVTYPTEDNTQKDDGGTNFLSVSATDGGSHTLTDNSNGTFSFKLTGDSYTYDRTNGLVAPFTADLTLTLSAFTDGDGVSGKTTEFSPSGNLLRYGQGIIYDSYGTFGAVGDSLAVPVIVEYFDGSNWVVNTDDSDSNTTYSLTTSDIGVTSSPTSPVTFTSGKAEIELTVNSAGSNPGGNVTVSANWPSWLEPDASAVATFGIFRGDDRFLYWEER